ncbi:MAG TPA: head GIN domain-containing protein [Anaerolineae bacterium]
MKKQVIFISVITILALCACTINARDVRGSGTVIRDDRPVAGIYGVTLATLGDMTIELGDQESLIIEAEDNLLPYLETEVRSGILTIRNTAGASLRPTRPVHYYLTVNSLETLSTTSSGNIDAPALQAEVFTTQISSSGDLHVAAVDADRIRVEISSSGNVVIDTGQVAEQDITISSSGDYQAGEVRSQAANARISSSGEATIWVTDSLDANLTSSGNVNYYGRPVINQTMSSSGKVISLGEK